MSVCICVEDKKKKRSRRQRNVQLVVLRTLLLKLGKADEPEGRVVLREDWPEGGALEFPADERRREAVLGREPLAARAKAWMEREGRRGRPSEAVVSLDEDGATARTTNEGRGRLEASVMPAVEAGAERARAVWVRGVSSSLRPG